MAVRDGGKACFIGISDVKTKAEVPITHVVRRRISLVGSYGARASVDMPDLLEIAAKGGVDLRGAITRRFTLEEAGEAYTLLQQRKIVGRAIVCFPGSGSGLRSGLRLGPSNRVLPVTREKDGRCVRAMLRVRSPWVSIYNI
eukprot:scaffold11995_cov61-Phaeocystis_antarctica.AAC.1